MTPQRTFSAKCIKCRQRTKVLTPVHYTTKFCHDGREYVVEIPSLVVPKCSNCQAISLDDEANRQIDLAFRRKAGLFTPEEIRARREALGLTQQQLADEFGVAVSTLNRWENGAQIQQRIMNDFLTLFFENSEVRKRMRELHGAATATLRVMNTTPNTVAVRSVGFTTFVNTPYVSQTLATARAPAAGGEFVPELVGG